MFRDTLSFLLACLLACLGAVTASDDAARPEELRHEYDEDGPLAEIVPLPPLKRSVPPAKPPTPGAAKADAQKQTPASAKLSSQLAVLPKEPGYTLVLSGVMDCNLELGPEQSPVLVRGNLIVPEGATLKIKAGTVIHLRAALPPPVAKETAQPAELSTQPANAGPVMAIWVLGTLLADGVTGNPVEITNQEKQPAALLLYGATQSRFDGVRLKDISVTQTGGVCQWTNCELTGVPHYALAAGAGLFTHCSFHNCGGVFATYNLGPWSLLARRNLFDGCREGIVLGSDPGEMRLIIEKNNFAKTRGANIRVMNAVGAKGAPDPKAKAGDMELFIGENWYGSMLLEEAEMRLVDRRFDSSVHARLNTRPPAERPYANTGVGVPANVLAATLREQQALQQKLLQAHPWPQQQSAGAAQPAVMSKTASRPK